ncbi:MAG TPA: hypothetical protein VGG61_09835, partial [Gemmataceae bacterium]
MSFICFIIWIVFACAVGTAASRHYKRSGFGWGVLAVLISPLLAWLLLLLLGTNPDGQQPQPQPQRGVNWKNIDWRSDSEREREALRGLYDEIVTPRPVVIEAAPLEPMSKTAMWFWLSAIFVIIAILITL